MSCRARRARTTAGVQGEDGIGLVELMASILVIGMVLMALASGLVTSLREISNNEDLVNATAIHQEILESTVSLEWELIGFYTDDPDFVATVPHVEGDADPEVMVSLGASGGTPDSRAPERFRTVTRNGTEYDVTLDIYWVDADGDTVDVDDTKRLRTTITWEDGARTNTNVSHATRAETGEEARDAFGVSIFAPSQNKVALNASGQTAETITFTVRFTDGAFPGTITYVDASGNDATLTLGNPDANNEVWSVTMPIGTSVQSGQQVVEVEASSIDDPAVTARLGLTLEFVADADPPPDTSFAITGVAITGGSVTYNSDLEGCTYVVRIKVAGFTVDDVVELTYQYWNNATGNSSEKEDTVQAIYRTTESSSGIFEATVPYTAKKYLRSDETITLTASASSAADNTLFETRSLTLTPTGPTTC